MGRLAAGLLVLGCCLALQTGCAKPLPAEVLHRVKPGETIYRIARYYEVSPLAVTRANGIRDVRRVQPGTLLRIPGARRGPAQEALPPPRTNPRAEADARGLRFGWPVSGTITSRYGWRRGRVHEGIDIAARKGTPVKAAAGGRVVYSGNGLGAYGNVIIVRHTGEFETVYAHNRKNRVRRGQQVRKGQAIAEVGATGNATGPHLHFEIRKRDRARDPLLYLP